MGHFDADLWQPLRFSSNFREEYHNSSKSG